MMRGGERAIACSARRRSVWGPTCLLAILAAVLTLQGGRAFAEELGPVVLPEDGSAVSVKDFVLSVDARPMLADGSAELVGVEVEVQRYPRVAMPRIPLVLQDTGQPGLLRYVAQAPVGPGLVLVSCAVTVRGQDGAMRTHLTSRVYAAGNAKAALLLDLSGLREAAESAAREAGEKRGRGKTEEQPRPRAPGWEAPRVVHDRLPIDAEVLDARSLPDGSVSLLWMARGYVWGALLAPDGTISSPQALSSPAQGAKVGVAVSGLALYVLLSREGGAECHTWTGGAWKSSPPLPELPGWRGTRDVDSWLLSLDATGGPRVITTGRQDTPLETTLTQGNRWAAWSSVVPDLAPLVDADRKGAGWSVVEKRLGEAARIFSDPPLAMVNSDGRALLVWHGSSVNVPTQGDARWLPQAAHAYLLDPARGWRGPLHLPRVPRYDAQTTFSLDPAGNLVELGARQTPDGLAISVRRSPMASWNGEPGLLAPKVEFRGGPLEEVRFWLSPRFGPSGSALVVCYGTSLPEGDRMHAARRSPKGDWSTLDPIGPADGSSYDSNHAAVDVAGNATVAWFVDDEILANRAPVSGAWGAPVTLGAEDDFEPRSGAPRVCLDAAGRAVVLWVEGGRNGVWRVVVQRSE